MRQIPTPHAGPTEADWQGLARLFAGDQMAFRHRMGLSKSGGHTFYESTQEAASIRAEKEAILQSPDADLYQVVTREGIGPFREFCHTLGLSALAEAECDEASHHRAVTLALEPDWLLLTPPDWRLVRASVCFPTRWSLAGKANLPLPEIHAVVPGLNEELGRKIDVFFRRLLPGEGWSRANWGLTASGQRNQHPSKPRVPLSNATPIESVLIRIESQHFLKLPDTGAIAFGIRILNFPLAQAQLHADIIAGLKSQLRTMPEAVSAYKAIPANFWQRL